MIILFDPSGPGHGLVSDGQLPQAGGWEAGEGPGRLGKE